MPNRGQAQIAALRTSGDVSPANNSHALSGLSRGRGFVEKSNKRWTHFIGVSRAGAGTAKRPPAGGLFAYCFASLPAIYISNCGRPGSGQSMW
jgi:hypothetical protein